MNTFGMNISAVAITQTSTNIKVYHSINLPNTLSPNNLVHHL